MMCGNGWELNGACSGGFVDVREMRKEREGGVEEGGRRGRGEGRGGTGR